MKRKRASAKIDGAAGKSEARETVIPEALIAEVRRALEAEEKRPRAKCVVCGDETAPASNEGLCWVCRRLKLSAWRDMDSQMPAQE